MEKSYNQIAGKSIERIAALSDGLFAIAMTLIVLEIHVPEHTGIHSESELWGALATLSPRVLTYLLSFMTLGILVRRSNEGTAEAHQGSGEGSARTSAPWRTRTPDSGGRRRNSS